MKACFEKMLGNDDRRSGPKRAEVYIPTAKGFLFSSFAAQALRGTAPSNASRTGLQRRARPDSESHAGRRVLPASKILTRSFRPARDRQVDP